MGHERGADRLSQVVDQWCPPIRRQNIQTLLFASRARIEMEVEYRSADTDLVIASTSANGEREESLVGVLQSRRAPNDVNFFHAVEEIVID